MTSDITKATLPGKKKVLRALNPGAGFIEDVICLAEDEPREGDKVYDPVNPLLHAILPHGVLLKDLRRVVMEEGRRLDTGETLEAMAERCKSELLRLPAGCLRFINPHRYKVSISDGLNRLRNTLIEESRVTED